tara:strand:+ start:5408 stop:5965 length:558 start_codon:yes stop_codon:yes gene_type:complete
MLVLFNSSTGSSSPGHRRLSDHARQVVEKAFEDDRPSFEKLGKKLIELHRISNDRYAKFLKSKELVRSALERSKKSENKELDLHSLEAIDKTESKIQGGIELPNPKEGELIMQAQGRAKWRENWVDPDLGYHHDSNKKDAHFQARINRDLDALVKEFLSATGMKKKDFTEKAFLSFLQSQSCNID